MKPITPPIYGSLANSHGVAGAYFLVESAWPTWSLLALGILLLGVLGRLSGSPLALTVALDITGLGFWLCGPRLAHGFAKVLRRQWAHRQPRLSDLPQLLRNAWLLLLMAYPLVLAGTGLLVAFGVGTELAEIQMEYRLALSVYTQRLLLGPAVLMSILAIGPLLLVGSAALFALLRQRCGTYWGSLLWLAAGLAVHVPLICGTSTKLGLWSTPEHGALGSFLQGAINMFTVAGSRMTYTDDLILRLLIIAAATMLGVLLLVVGVQFTLRSQSQDQSSASVPLAWLAALAGIAAPVLYTSLHGINWTQDVTASTTGDWRAPFAIGIAAILCSAVALGPISRRAACGWVLLCPVAWVLLSTPYIRAGLITRESILGAALISWGCLLVLSPLLRISISRSLSSAGSIVSGIVLVLLFAVPGDSGTSVLQEMIGAVGAGLFDPAVRQTALLILGTVYSAGAVLWLLFWRRPLVRKRKTGV